MNTLHHSRPVALLVVLSVFATATAVLADDREESAINQAQPALPATTPSPAVSEIETAWGFTLRPLDQWTRMHLILPPMIGPVGENLIVESIQPRSSAETWNFEIGDIILESERGPIGKTEQIGSPNERQFFRIIRRGTPNMVHRKPWDSRGMAPSGRPMHFGPMGATPPMPPGRGTAPQRNQATSSASSFSSGGSAVAISQAGDQIQIEVSENGVQHRFSGSPDAIGEQVKGKNLSPATRNKIDTALERMRRR